MSFKKIIGIGVLLVGVILSVYWFRMRYLLWAEYGTSNPLKILNAKMHSVQMKQRMRELPAGPEHPKLAKDNVAKSRLEINPDPDELLHVTPPSDMATRYDVRHGLPNDWSLVPGLRAGPIN
jgi:hypothetical protein